MSSLFRLECKQKICLRIRIILLSSCYSFGIETINTFVHSRSSPENHTRFLTKMGKSLPVFWPKFHNLWGGTNLYVLYKEVTPTTPSPHPWRARKAKIKYSQTLYRHTLNMDTSMLWTVSCVPGERKPLYFSLKFNPLNTDTFNAPPPPPPVSVLV